jgi:Zn-dependent protease with chaperone function
MRVGLSLLLYGCLVAASGRLALRLRGRSSRAPRLGIAMWQVLAWSVVAAWIGGGLALAQVGSPLDGVERLVESCWSALHGQAPSEVVSSATRAVGLAIVTLTAGRVLWSVGRGAVVTLARRRRHVDAVRLVGRRSPGVPALVVDHDRPVAYCVPGRDGQVVLSSAALAALTTDQLGAVLEHEWAHLRGRHHLAVLWARALERAFPRVRLFRTAAREIGVLLEMCADDAAARRWGRSAVASALRSLSSGPSPAGALAAASVAAGERIDRLERNVPGRPRRSSLLLVAAALASGPVVAAAMPLLVALAHHLAFCPTHLG